MGALTTFLYGWGCGILGIVLCILYGFDTLLFIMRHLNRVLAVLHLGGGDAAGRTRAGVLSAAADAVGIPRTGRLAALRGHTKTTLREQGLEGIVASSTSEAAPLKMSAVCSVTWWSEHRFGLPIRCRLQLIGHCLTVYELLPSAGSPHAGAGGVAGVAGGGSGAGAAVGEERDGGGVMAAAEHLRGRTLVDRLEPRVVKSLPKDKSRPNNPFTGKVLVLRTRDGRPFISASDSDGPGMGDDGGGGGTLRADLSSDAASPTQARSSGDASFVSSGLGGPMSPTSGSARRGLNAWTSVVIKFRGARETERWENMLRGVREAEAWRDFAKSLPNPDTANSLLSRFFFQSMRSEGFANGIKRLIQKELKKVSATKFPRDVTGEILLDDFVIGKQIPWISDVSDPTVSANGEMGFDFNLHYKGGDEGLALFFRIALAYRDIRIPHVVLSLKVHELEATVHVSIGPPPSKKFWIAGHQPPVLKLEVHQGCASGKGLLHRILTSLPDLSGIVTNLLKLYIISDMVLPYMDDFPIPNFDATPKSSPTAAPKTRVFDRRRAATKSAAPDVRVAVPATFVNPSTDAGAVEGVGRYPRPSLSPSLRSGGAGERHTQPSLSTPAGGDSLPPVLRGGAAVPHSFATASTHSGTQPSVRVGGGGSGSAQMVWSSSSRRSTLLPPGVSGPLSIDGGSAHSPLPAPFRDSLASASARSPGGPRGSYATPLGGGGSGGGGDREWGGSEYASAAEVGGTRARTDSLAGEGSENDRRARKARAASLRLALKAKGADMDRGSVAKAVK